MQPSRRNGTLHFVVNTLIAFWVLTSASCYEEYAILSDHGLSEVPKDLQQNVIVLDLSNNNITTIERNDFSKVKKVKNSNLSYNNIRKIHDGSFEHLGDLEEVDLSYNSIIYLPPNLFSGNNNLTKVYLMKNWLQVTVYAPKAGHILERISLTYLDISFCNITSVSRESFSGLPNLQTLKMSGNSLKQLDFGLTKLLKNLKEMHIEFCNPSTFEKVFSHLRQQIMHFTLLPPRSSLDKTRDRDWTDLNFLTPGTIMAAFVFFVTLTVYIVITRCKTRRAADVASEKPDLENIIELRPLPQPPDPNDGCESPVTPKPNRFLSICSRSRQVNSVCGYNSLLMVNNLTTGKRNVSGKGHVLTGRTPGSIQSLPYTTKCQDSKPYRTPNQIHSHQNRNEEKKLNLSTTRSVPKLLQFHEEYQAPCMRSSSNVEGLSTIALGTLPNDKAFVT
jgi:hypothetical protein